MIARAQEKVDAIRRAKEKTGELRPINEVDFVHKMSRSTTRNGNIHHNGRATSYLATLVMSIHA